MTSASTSRASSRTERRVTINRDPARRDLVSFGIALPVFFALVGFLVAERTASELAPRAIWVGGAIVTVVYAGVRAARRPIFVGWSYLAYPIGWVVTHALLMAVFLLLITPIGLLVRLFGQDPLPRKYDPSARSYWIPKEETARVRRYFQQF